MLRALRHPALLAIALGVCAVLAPLARADIVHLNTGGVVKGEIIAETDEGVKIKTAGGVTTIFREDIAKIERGATPESTYQERLKKLAPNDADGHYQLGAYLRKIRMEKEARECFEKALRIDPTHFPARAALAEEAARKEAALVAVADDDKGGGSEPAPVVKGKIPGDAFKQLESFKAKTRDAAAAPEKRAEGWAGLAALHAAAADPAQKEAILAYATAIETGHRKTYEKNAKRLAGAIPDYDKAEQRKIRDRYREAWEAAVKDALAAIFDLKIYPDENHGKVGQPIVDEKVEVVKKAYPAYDQLLTHDLARFNAIGDEQAKTFALALERGRTLLGEARTALGEMGVQGLKALPEEPPAAHRALILYRAGRIEDAYALKDGLSPWETRLLERLRDVRVESYNDRLLKDPAPPAKGKRPNGEERKQVAITNQYRMLMGRDALEIHLCLVESARGHSNEMTQLGYFAHESPVERNRTPSDRARNAGYEGGAAENISMGSVSAQATHDAWYNSSGHHRNILGNHRAMGSGLDGQHWTQNFGSAGELVR